MGQWSINNTTIGLGCGINQWSSIGQWSSGH